MNHRRVSCILCTVAFVCIRERNLGYAAESTPDQVPAYAEKQTLSASVSPLPLFMSTAGARNVWSPTLSRSRWVSFALSFVHPILLDSLLIHSLFFFIWLADTQVRCERRERSLATPRLISRLLFFSVSVLARFCSMHTPKLQCFIDNVLPVADDHLVLR